MLEELNDDDEAPWKESHKGQKSELTAHRLAALLKKYDVKSDLVRYPDGSESSPPTRGYLADDLEKTIEKYARDGF